MLSLSLIQKVAIWAIPVLLAVTLHEAAHALVAARCGDTTAKMLGRLSLNPLKHVDLFGTILVPLLMGFLSDFQFIFGWAKPVPINWTKLRNPRRDMALVAAAGPAVNLMMVVFWAILLKVGLVLTPESSMPGLFLLLTAQAGIFINLILALLNLIPIPPLDGSRVVASFLSPKHAVQYFRIEPYGFFVLILLLMTGILGWIINPLLSGALVLIKSVLNL